MKLLKPSVLALALSTCLSAGFMASAEDVKHKVIEIKSVNKDGVNVFVEDNADKRALVLTEAELSDDATILEKLSDLDPETQQTIMDALDNVRLFTDGELSEDELISESLHKVVVLNKGEGNVVKVIGDGDNVFKHKVFFADSETTLKGHTSAITKMIEMGEFTQEELDDIQAALDLKR